MMSGDDDECHLLQGPGAFAAQGALFVFVLLSLAYKRHRETPKRQVKIWALDVSKQVFSAGAAHVSNMLIAINASMKSSKTSECAWYFVVFTFDTTIGVTLAIQIHKLFVNGASKLYLRNNPNRSEAAETDNKIENNWLSAIANCGQYGEPPSYGIWAWQMAEWTLATLIARIICGFLIIALRNFGLEEFAGVLDNWFDGHPELELAFVMVACPVGMNLLQAWIQDTVLKMRKKKQITAQDTEMDNISLLARNWGGSSDP